MGCKQQMNAKAAYVIERHELLEGHVLPQGPLWKRVEFVEEGRYKGGIEGHKHHGDEEHKCPQIKSDERAAIEQDVHKGG